MKLHRGGSAPAACTSGLFNKYDTCFNFLVEYARRNVFINVLILELFKYLHNFVEIDFKLDY